MKYFSYVIAGLVIAAVGTFLGSKYDPFGLHHFEGPHVQFQGGGLVGEAYVTCSAPTGVYATARPSAPPKSTTGSWSADGKIFYVGCDGNPVGPYHYQGLVQTQAQQSPSGAACLSSPPCQINAEVATGIAASPAPTCPPSQQCLAFNGTMTNGQPPPTNIAVSGLIVVSSSSIPRLTGVGAGTYVSGSAATAWQHPFSVCKLGAGRCQMDLFLATVPAPGTVTTSMVAWCSPNAQECLAFNGTSMASVNDSQTVGAAITIDMPSQ